jgi:protein-tyrosine phosphatase
LRKLRPEVESLSTGFISIQGRHSPAAAVSAAAKFNIDLSDHRSAVISRDSVARADAVFVFDLLNQADFAREYPQFLSKLHYIGALDRRGNMEITDPYGGSSENFFVTYERILDLLTSVLDGSCAEAKPTLFEICSR